MISFRNEVERVTQYVQLLSEEAAGLLERPDINVDTELGQALIKILNEAYNFFRQELHILSDPFYFVPKANHLMALLLNGVVNCFKLVFQWLVSLMQCSPISYKTVFQALYLVFQLRHLSLQSFILSIHLDFVFVVVPCDHFFPP
ncbi:hypothetical protein V6N12_046420 [Hibiscus sabdariffa]|uniref:Uncharacterized protein n=1 Tax=Hibiscus sabdariffa TaxID=183260 RepID=A0ABR2DIL3_9ROSI